MKANRNEINEKAKRNTFISPQGHVVLTDIGYSLAAEGHNTNAHEYGRGLRSAGKTRGYSFSWAENRRYRRLYVRSGPLFRFGKGRINNRNDSRKRSRMQSRRYRNRRVTDNFGRGRPPCRKL